MRRQKYQNITIFCSLANKTFHSKGEHKCYHILHEIEKRGVISELKDYSNWNLVVKEKKICQLRLDFEFTYVNKVYFVDYKSVATLPPGFKLKVKLFEAIVGETVTIIDRATKGLLDTIFEENIDKLADLAMHWRDRKAYPVCE